MMSLLDVLEERFTRKIVERKPRVQRVARLLSFSRWISPGLPDRDWKATDRYSLSLYLRYALGSVARLSLCYYVLWLVMLACIIFQLWHSYPVLFHPGRMQARIWHRVWQSLGPMLMRRGFIFIPFVPLAWALFALILWLPRVLFWNRRARRLQGAGEVASVQEIAEAVAPDASVWPPPPRLKV